MADWKHIPCLKGGVETNTEMVAGETDNHNICSLDCTEGRGMFRSKPKYTRKFKEKGIL